MKNDLTAALENAACDPKYNLNVCQLKNLFQNWKLLGLHLKEDMYNLIRYMTFMNFNGNGSYYFYYRNLDLKNEVASK